MVICQTHLRSALKYAVDPLLSFCCEIRGSGGGVGGGRRGRKDGGEKG